MCTWTGCNEIYSKLFVLVPATSKAKLAAAARLNIFFFSLDCKQFVLTENMHRNMQLNGLKFSGTLYLSVRISILKNEST
jgi:hypothetical protein